MLADVLPILPKYLDGAGLEGVDCWKRSCKVSMCFT